MAYYVLTHPNIDEVERLRREHRELEAKNDRMERRNEQLRRKIDALRENPAFMARRARQRAGMVRPGEMVLQFDDERERRSLRIRVEVDDDELTVAGESSTTEELEERLSGLKERLPESVLRIRFSPSVEPIRKARILEIVDQSAFEASEVETEEMSG